MSKRDWERGAAAVLAVLVVLWLFWLPYNLHHKSERRDAREAEKYITEEYIQLRCGGVPIEDRALCATQQLDAISEEKRSEYDLKAQQEMAEWALLVVVATTLSLFVSIGGLVALIWTFREQRNTSENQSRAFVEIITGRTTVSEYGSWSTEVTVMNTGQTPAFNVAMRATVRFFTISFDSENPARPKIAWGVRKEVDGIGPSGLKRFSFHMNTTMPQEAIRGMKNKDGEVIGTGDETLPYVDIFGTVTFTDAFGKPREVSFHLESVEMFNVGTYPLFGGSERGTEHQAYTLRHEKPEGGNQ